MWFVLSFLEAEGGRREQQEKVNRAEEKVPATS